MIYDYLTVSLVVKNGFPPYTEEQQLDSVQLTEKELGALKALVKREKETYELCLKNPPKWYAEMTEDDAKFQRKIDELMYNDFSSILTKFERVTDYDTQRKKIIREEEVAV